MFKRAYLCILNLDSAGRIFLKSDLRRALGIGMDGSIILGINKGGYPRVYLANESEFRKFDEVIGPLALSKGYVSLPRYVRKLLRVDRRANLVVWHDGTGWRLSRVMIEE